MTPVAEDAEEDETSHETTGVEPQIPEIVRASYRGENKKSKDAKISGPRKNKIHFAIQDMCNWIAHKEIVSMLVGNNDTSLYRDVAMFLISLFIFYRALRVILFILLRRIICAAGSQAFPNLFYCLRN